MQIHGAVVQLAKQFVQRWFDVDADERPIREVVALAVGDDKELQKMLSVNDLLARMVKRVKEHTAKSFSR